MKVCKCRICKTPGSMMETANGDVVCLNCWFNETTECAECGERFIDRGNNPDHPRNHGGVCADCKAIAAACALVLPGGYRGYTAHL